MNNNNIPPVTYVTQQSPLLQPVQQQAVSYAPSQTNYQAPVAVNGSPVQATNVPPSNYLPPLFVYAPQGVFPVPGVPNLVVIPEGQARNNPYAAIGQQLQNFYDGASTLQVRGMVSACLWCYIFGLFFWVPYIISIIISLMFVHRQYIVEKKGAVIALAVMELIFWLFVPAFSWYSIPNCWYDYYNYERCDYFYFGWISFVFLFFFGLVFGIPRVIFTQRCERLASTSSSPVVYATSPVSPYSTGYQSI